MSNPFTFVIIQERFKYKFTVTIKENLMENKKVLVALFVLFLSFFTIGCSNQKADISSQDSSLSATTSQVTTNELSKKDYKEFYKPIFDDYQKILSSPKDLTKIVDLYKNLNATDRPINSWSVENAVF